MAQHWQEMLPIDRYTVAASGLLHDYDRKVLTLLYQPLIGSVCFSLYMTLWAELEENRLWSSSNSHHSLMNFMGMGLKDIYEARLKLEGIGLLKVYVNKDEETRSFIYELLPPLTPEQFFLDGMLNIYLYKKLGKNQFMRLKRFFSDQKVQPARGYKEVTKAFQDVFQSGHPGSFDDEVIQLMNETDEAGYIGRREQEGIQIGSEDFNFELLQAGLNESLVPKKALTVKVKESISNLAFLYGIDPIQMKNIVISAVNEDNEINIDELRKSARDWYQFQNQDMLPSLIDRVQPASHQSQKKQPETQEEELIRYLEITSPRQLLKDISGGAEPSKGDLQIIEDVMFQQKLLPGVINVLIQYVMLKTDMKLTKGYVEKIAGHWARKKIKTPQEAIELAKKEHRQYLDWAEGKKTAGPAGNKRKPIRTEMLPDWFDENSSEAAKKEQAQQQNSEKEQYERELKKRELKEKLKKLRSQEVTD
ncbi:MULTISPECIES: replication initiation and membrane attachment family protein [Bacillaceae]|jgi:replication initiation and membrane attachment protein|uniref:Replication initiation and membrane attachment family protein n=1 Tax=Cytobacillus firmus TaxID=1399 RepID=A0AA46P7D5_CYTFI|nr:MULTISPECIES: replication initiation and membrane attachment family protein [Bacillaceae]KML45422.1 Replication initiation and membrane attachment protein [Cytobacillus firmus]MCS0654481.1 replication initiation and membrane attachment family protein [Cytobacillus firmus]MCU1805338.1 replication initiation and membrane attachment family protein [Cytobacillus firmus]UYG94321.1 replication initiation and membrane attachment family protein [Cytobacillus firmus]WHY33341.1 replication initiation